MPSAVELYDELLAAPDDKARARLIAVAFERLEERYPAMTDLATQSGVRETELRLQKEIKETEGRLRLEIEAVRKEITEVEGQLKLEIEQVRKEIAGLKVDLIKWIVGLLIAQAGLLAAVFGGIAKLLISP